jgi:hypothetical protein
MNPPDRMAVMNELAREARSGKADPRGRLCEPVPADGEPWWSARARFLRRKQKWSYQKIADDLGVSYRSVYKQLNRERVRKTDRKSEHKHRVENTQRQLAKRRADAALCERCGAQLSRKTVRAPVCQSCSRKAAAEVQATIAELFLAGWTLAEIDKFVGRPKGSSGAIISVLRKRGMNLPYRANVVGVTDQGVDDEGSAIRAGTAA